jgi:hypothetical protein
MRAPRLVLLLCGLALAAPARAEVRFVDAVVAEVGGAVVTASDVALARALGLLGLAPAAGPLSAAEIERYVDGRLLADEAARIDVAVTDGERAEAWSAVAVRLGGESALAAWLAGAGVDASWARRTVEADLGMRRFVELRFQALAFVSEAEVSTALGPGPHSDGAREATRARLEDEAAHRRLTEWLVEARVRAAVRWLVSQADPIPDPLPRSPGGPLGR